MVAVTFPRLNVTIVRVSITMAGNASGKWPAVVLVMIAGLTPFAVDALVADRAGASFNPSCWRSVAAQLGRVHLDLVKKPKATAGHVRATNSNRLDIGQDGHEDSRLELGPPSKSRVLVQSELVVLHLVGRHGVTLVSDCKGDGGWIRRVPAHNHNILHRGSNSGHVLCTNFQLEPEIKFPILFYF